MEDNMKDNYAFKDSADKLPYEIDWQFITQMAVKMQMNKNKYEPYNWKKKLNIEDMKQALTRHFIDFQYHMENNDIYSAIDALTAISTNAMIINYQLKTY